MIFILYPHQLFRDTSHLRGKKVLLIEEPLFFTQYTFHLQKLVLHRASMKFYESYLLSLGIDVTYYEDESYRDLYKDSAVYLFDLVDYDLQKKVYAHFSNVTTLANPNFINTNDSTKFFHSFYINRRKELGLLLDDEKKPLGGKWSFDGQNRKKLPKDYKNVVPLQFENRFIDEAKIYCKKFKTHSSCDIFYYPVTFDEAEILLEYFLYHKFALFGDYQDAIACDESFVYHANISCALNIGLLDLQKVIEKIVSAEGIALNAKEGFLRQIIGWREFMLANYKQSGSAMRTSNFFALYNKMPQKILDAQTDIAPLDDTLQKVKKNGYAHHIERLMVLGNFFLLLEIDPNEVYEYFMSHFIDAYDWVMVANVYAMSGYSDGGSITTKPYISSSNYLLKMSDYKKGAWCEVMDALYWSFLDKHAQKLAQNPRMKMQLALLEKMDKKKLQAHKQKAKEFKQSLGLYELSETDINRLIEMAWQDRTPFDAIQKLYGLTHNQVVKIMRKEMQKSSFVMWRKRMNKRDTKHLKKISHKATRFQGPW